MTKSYRQNKNKAERDSLICSMYKDYALTMDIARELKISKNTVTKVLKEKGLYDINRNKNHINKEKIERNLLIIEKYKDGKSFRCIAEEMGIGHTTVEYVIHSYNERNPIQYGEKRKRYSHKTEKI